MTGTSATAIGYASSARLRWIEALPWVLAAAIYLFAPTYLPFAGYVLIMILFALSLDLILGYGGIVTLGHSAYFGFGAYVAGIFAIPVSYEAPVTILPPEKNNQMGGLSSLLGGEDFSSLITSGMSNANAQLYMEMLKSRTASLYVVKKNGLVKFYDSKNEIEAAKKLSEKLSIDINKEGILKLSVNTSTSFFPIFTSQSDSLRRFSAALSNSFVEALDVINREKLSSKAKRARIYIESQLQLPN